MVIKTEVCAFSDTRIYPGHGVRMIRRDGQVRARTMPRLRTNLTHEPYNFLGSGLWVCTAPAGEAEGFSIALSDVWCLAV